MENIDDFTKSETNIGGDTFTCPKCGKPQVSFVDRGHGWIRCPECDVGIQKRDIPEEYHHLFIKAEKKPEIPKKTDDKVPSVKQKVVQTTQSQTRTTKPQSERDDLFERPKEDWQILSQVLSEFKVPDTVSNYIVKRAKRSGSMDPNELSRALTDLKSKLTQKEITYVSEEYYEAVMAERERRKEDSSYRPYPSFSSTESGGQNFRWQKGSQGQQQDSRNLPPWEKDRRTRDNALTQADFERLWNERVEKVESKKKIDELQTTINNMGNAMMQMETQLKNPPKVDDSDKFYKMFIEQERKSNERLMDIMKQGQNQRDGHNKELIDLYKNQATRSSTEGYKEDSLRLVADSINTAASVMQTNKPLQTAIKSVAQGQSVPVAPAPGEEIELIEGAEVGILSEVRKLRSDIVVDE